MLDLIKTKVTQDKIIFYNLSSKKRIILVYLKKNDEISDLERLGSNFYDLIKNTKENKYFLFKDFLLDQQRYFIGHFLHGLKLKSYFFEKYNTIKS